MRLVKTIGLTLLLAAGMQLCAAAKEQEAFYTGEKIKGYDKGSFVVLEADDINFRSAAEDGNVLKVLPHHSLLRVIRQSGDWLEAESDGVDGFIYAPYTVAGSRDELTQEYFALGYAALGQKFDEQKAEERLGAVKQEKIDKKRKQINYTFEGAVISVARKKQAVDAIRVVDPKYITMRGVSIGDSAGRAVGQYGLPDAVVYAADNTTYEYFWEDDKEQPLRFALEVDKQSRVTAFILEKLKKK